ncbi:hypothetical protein [Streptomyces sp. NPDC021608]|uniref:hypothetical protein n=2 Tax=Streptomyces TaxID=1883 RepID=UPI0033D9BC48
MPTHRTPDGATHDDADDRPRPDLAEPPEHARFAAYLDALDRVPAAEEASLVRRVLTDEDVTMARSAVVRHLDRTAAAFPRATADDESWHAWTEAMGTAVGKDAFLTTRLGEWTLLRALTTPSDARARIAPPATPGTAGAIQALGTASDWLQRRLVEAPDASPQALGFLAEHGRTKKVRAAAANRVR